MYCTLYGCCLHQLTPFVNPQGPLALTLKPFQQVFQIHQMCLKTVLISKFNYCKNIMKTHCCNTKPNVPRSVTLLCSMYIHVHGIFSWCYDSHYFSDMYFAVCIHHPTVQGPDLVDHHVVLNCAQQDTS